MELRQLRYFIAAARKESFRKAAEELHVAQSALSRRIAELEAQLGVELFIRRKRRVYLSPAGHFYLSRIEPLVSGIEGVSAHLRQFGSGMSGELTIGYHAVAGRHEVTSTCLAQCRKLMPEVELKLIQMTSQAQEAALLAGQIDLAFGYREANMSPNIAGLDLAEDKAFVVFPKSDRTLATMAAIRLADLRDRDFILTSPDTNPSYYHWLIDACGAGGLQPKVVQFAHSELILINFVATGLGIAIVLAADSSKWREDLVFRPIVDFPASMTLALMWDARRQSPATDRFIEVVRSTMRPVG